MKTLLKAEIRSGGLVLVGALLGLFLTACLGDDPEGIQRAQTAQTTVKMDFYHRPLPEIPLPNDIATRYDAASATGRRVNASMVAPTAFESHTRGLIDQLDGWGILQHITIPFTGPLDIDSILAHHRDADYDLSDDVVYLIDIDRDSPEFGRLHHLDVGNGNYPVVLESIGRYWPNDPRGWTISLAFEEEDEDRNGNGVLDQGEDLNRNGVLDPGEDLDDDGLLDPPEDTDADGVLDRPNYLPGHSPERSDLAGRADALMTFYESETNTLIMRPMVPLRERTTYAVVVTRRLLDAAGQPVGSPYSWVHHLAQTTALSPLPEVLPEGLAMSDVAFAFTYTTGTVVSEMVAVRDGLYGHGLQGHLGRDFPAEIEELLELRDTSRVSVENPLILYNESWTNLIAFLAPEVFGIDPESQELQAILRSQRYVDYHVIGSFLSPQLMTREDEEGMPLGLNDQSWPHDLDRVVAPAEPERIYFWLTVPRPEVSARGQGEPAPVALLAHGYGSNRFESLIFNGHFAQHGVAVLSIDSYGHGLVVPESDRDTVIELAELFGFEKLFSAMLNGRAIDLDNDGEMESGGDFWTSYLFHTRDVIRQSLLDHMQLVRIVRSFDGERRWQFDVDGDGENELAGDFDADGHIDIGGDAHFSAIGGSLGGFMSTLLGELEPAIETVVPISGGGGLSDAGIRSLQGGVPEGFILRVMCPLYIGSVDAESGEMALRTIVPNVNRTAQRHVATVQEVMAGDTVLIENTANDEVSCGYVSPEGTLRVSVESDLGDGHRLDFYRGPSLVPGGECELLADIEPYASVDEFGVEVEFQGEIFDAGSPLVSLAEGLGLRRATPDLRRFLPLGQLVLDRADPASFARHLIQEPLRYPGTGEETGAHTIIVTTMGDMGVPASTGLTLGRAAGFIDYLEPDPRYGVPVNQVLLDTYTAEAVNTYKRYVHAQTGEGVHIDIENFSRGTDIWGDDIPRLDPPLNLFFDTDLQGRELGGYSGALFPFPIPEGMHGFPFPGQLIDRAIDQCESECDPVENPEGCDCHLVETFDVGFFMFNIFGSYVISQGREFNIDLCNSSNDCEGFAPPPEPRPASELL